MTLEELYTAMIEELPELAAQTFYDHIVIEEGEELAPPFIFFHEVDSAPFITSALSIVLMYITQSATSIFEDRSRAFLILMI